MSEYDTQAADFLTATNSKLVIELSEAQTAPLWSKSGEKHGHKYDVTLSNDNGTYKFNFWDSIANSEDLEALNTLKNSQRFTPETSEQYKAQDKWPKMELKRQINAKEILSALAFTVAQGYDEETVDNIIEELGLDGESKIYNQLLADFRKTMAQE